MYNVFVLCIVIYCNSVEINIHSFIHSGTSVYKAAKLTGVPKQILEESLTKHIIRVAMCGYGYTRFDLHCFATYLVVYLNKRTSSENVLSEQMLSMQFVLTNKIKALPQPDHRQPGCL